MLTDLETHMDSWENCRRCSLQKGVRVFYRLSKISKQLDLIFWGEAPGESETVLGKPFVGPAGKLLDKIILEAVGPNVSYLVGNTVLCTPPRVNGKIRSPTVDEKETCFDRFLQLVEIVKPKSVVAVGKEATQTLGEYADASIVHPSYILRLSDRPVAKQVETTNSINIIRSLVNG